MARFSGKYVETRFRFGKAPEDGGAPNRGGPTTPEEFWVFAEDDGSVSAVTFRCPCGCGSECYTPVTDATKGQPKTERHWLYSRGPNGATLSPSIRYTSGCKAHFNITDGRAEFHGDSGK